MRALLAPLAVGLILAACGNDANPSAKPKVAVSIFPLYDIARRVAGDRLDVVLVLPPGRSEHGYEPTPQQMAQVSRARLAIVVGLEMDPWAERIVRGAAGDEVSIVRLGPAVDPRRLSEPEVGVDVVEHAREHRSHESERGAGAEPDGEASHEHAGHDAEDEAHEEHGGEGEPHAEDEGHGERGTHPGDRAEAHADERGAPDGHEGEVHADERGAHGDHDEHAADDHEPADEHGAHAGSEQADEGEHHHAHHHGAHDPHFWLDPVRMGRAVDRIVEAFGALDPAGAETFRTNGARVRAELAELHERIEARSRRWSRRTIVTFHGSFGYFAERYGLRIAAVIEPFPGREPTPRYMQDVLSAIEASGATALFSEPQLDPRPARVIAQRAGVTLHAIDPVGGTSGVDTYERLLEHDAAVFDRALGSAR